MNSKDVATVDNAMHLALEECENKISQAFGRVLKDTRIMGRELGKIRDRELYRARHCEDFEEYCTDAMGYDMSSVYRVLKIAEIVQRLEDLGLQLPNNESQVYALAKLAPELQGAVWKRIMDEQQSKDEAVSVEIIKREVDREGRMLAAKRAEEAAKAAERLAKEAREPIKRTGGVAIDLDEEGNGEQPPSRPGLSESGEAALAKIRRICGDQIADAIEDLRLPVPERDLKKWAEQDNQIIYNLAYYIAELRWSVTKALNYEQQSVDGGTTIDTLIHMCRSHGGRLGVIHDVARISIEILSA
jgi:hypothetical protein